MKAREVNKRIESLGGIVTRRRGSHRRYTVTVTREADAWLAQCDQEPTAHTWGPALVALRHAIIDTIILAADLPDNAVVDVRLTAGEDLGDDVVRAIDLDRPGRDGGSDSAEGYSAGVRSYFREAIL